jgi:hypothetical protein
VGWGVGPEHIIKKMTDVRAPAPPPPPGGGARAPRGRAVAGHARRSSS